MRCIGDERNISEILKTKKNDNIYNLKIVFLNPHP